MTCRRRTLLSLERTDHNRTQGQLDHLRLQTGRWPRDPTTRQKVRHRYGTNLSERRFV